MLAKLSSFGAPLQVARLAVILVHGRGATGESMLALVEAIGLQKTEDIAFLAPQAPGGSWYPYNFLTPIAQNEPYLSRSLDILAGVLNQVIRAGVSAERTVFVGFSQGACLSLEFIARHAQQYAGVAGLSGGLIGPPGKAWDYPGSLEHTPVFLGCSDVDPHIPEERVRETARVLEQLGAQVTTRIYPGMGHTVNEDELIQVRSIIEQGKL